MVKFSFFPFDVDLDIEDKPYVLLFGRTREGNKICVKHEFYPYIWVVLNGEEGEVRNTLENIDEVDINNIEKHTKILAGKEIDVLKVTLQTPNQMPTLRNILEKKGIILLEGDILYTRRYLIDNDISMFREYIVEGEETTPFPHCRCVIVDSIKKGDEIYSDFSNILAFDIESYPDMKSQDTPILMISFASENYKKVITWRDVEPREDYIEIVDGELGLLERFKEIIHERNPDIITGYFTDGYDFPQLQKRAQKYKIKLDIGVDNSRLSFGRGRRDEVNIKGTLHLDVFNLTKNMLRQSLKTDSLKLDDVAKELLGEKKHEVNIMELGSAWDDRDRKKLHKYCEYNLQDSLLTLNLCLKLLPSVIEMVDIVGLSPFDVSRLSLSQMVEWFLIKNAPKHNNLVPNKPTHDEVKERYDKILAGAFVFEPHPGLYHHIVLFDFKSIYPTIIASHNLSGASLRCKCCRDKHEVPLEGDLWFCQKKKAFLPEMIEDLIERRTRVKEIMKEKKTPLLDARQQGLKLLANSFYGYLAFNPSRWYSFEAANSTTAFGRYYIRLVINKMTEEGFKVIYSDTDSIFTTVEDEKEMGRVKKIVDEINSNLPGIMELEFEGHYPSGIFISTKEGKGGAKKRYAMIDDEDHIVIKGFESVRRNTSKIAREVQKKVISIILKENNPDKAFDYVKKIITDIHKNKLEVDDFIIKTRITKELGSYESIGPHVEIARRMEKSGIKVEAGSLIEYVICLGKGKVRDRAKIPHDADVSEIDSEYYINNQILPSLGKIFEVLGYNVDDLVNEQKQSKLEGFF